MSIRRYEDSRPATGSLLFAQIVRALNEDAYTDFAEVLPDIAEAFEHLTGPTDLVVIPFEVFVAVDDHFTADEVFAHLFGLDHIQWYHAKFLEYYGYQREHLLAFFDYVSNPSSPLRTTHDMAAVLAALTNSTDWRTTGILSHSSTDASTYQMVASTYHVSPAHASAALIASLPATIDAVRPHHPSAKYQRWAALTIRDVFNQIEHGTLSPACVAFLMSQDGSQQAAVDIMRVLPLAAQYVSPARLTWLADTILTATGPHMDRWPSPRSVMRLQDWQLAVSTLPVADIIRLLPAETVRRLHPDLYRMWMARYTPSDRRNAINLITQHEMTLPQVDAVIVAD